MKFIIAASGDVIAASEDFTVLPEKVVSKEKAKFPTDALGAFTIVSTAQPPGPMNRFRWLANAWQAKAAEALPKDTEVSRYQLRLAIVDAGYFATIKTLIQGLPAQQRERVQIYLDQAPAFRRGDQFFTFLKNNYPLSDQQLDDLFNLALATTN